MTSLQERAHTMAATPTNGATAYPEKPRPAVREQLPDVDIDDTLDPESAKLIAIQAWSHVRRDVRAVAKTNEYDGGGAKYKFRGVELAINAFSPATLRNGVNVIPFRKVSVYKETRTSGGKPQCDCTVTVTWRIYGPNGDFFEAETCGQATDTQDKASAKAQSVAYRVFLYEAGMIPTNDPEPEYTAHDRGEDRARDPQDYFTEIIRKSTSRDRVHQIRNEIIGLRIGREPIVNEEGENEELLEALDRVGKARFAKPQVSPIHDGHADGEYVSACAGCQREQIEADRAAAQ